MFFYIYVLHSKRSDILYIGYTSNLIRRVKEHNLGLNQSTKPYRPWSLIYYEACRNRNDAKRTVRYLKTNKGEWMVRRRVKEYLHNLMRFAWSSSTWYGNYYHTREWPWFTAHIGIYLFYRSALGGFWGIKNGENYDSHGNNNSDCSAPESKTWHTNTTNDRGQKTILICIFRIKYLHSWAYSWSSSWSAYLP